MLSLVPRLLSCVHFSFFQFQPTSMSHSLKVRLNSAIIARSGKSASWHKLLFSYRAVGRTPDIGSSCLSILWTFILKSYKRYVLVVGNTKVDKTVSLFQEFRIEEGWQWCQHWWIHCAYKFPSYVCTRLKPNFHF